MFLIIFILIMGASLVLLFDGAGLVMRKALPIFTVIFVFSILLLVISALLN